MAGRPEMSEVSQSVHLRETSLAHAVTLLESLHKVGRVVASNSGWTSLVPADIDDLQEICREAQRAAALWSYSEDYALELLFFREGADLGRICFCWDANGGVVGTSVYEILVLLVELERVGVITTEAGTGLLELAKKVAVSELRGKEVRDEAAAHLGLPAYAWLSHENCFEPSLDEFRLMFPEAVDVEI
jgi:hypothetical protein